MDLTIEEYLAHCAAIHWIEDKDIPAAVDKALGYCGLTHFRKRLIRNLSGGYQQRVGIAQAIIHDPEFVVLDEPTNGLDPNQIIEIRNLIKEIAQDRTVVISTHILSEVQAMCKYIRMIEEGQLVFAGTVEDFDNYIQPNTIFVKLREAPDVSRFKEFPDIIDAEDLGQGQFRIKFSGDESLVERITERAVKEGWRLMEIRLERTSLDTIFAELSNYNKKKSKKK
jgi:ABC-2 type transport system ATP-binding protein